MPDLLKRDRTVRRAKLALFPIHEGLPKVVEIAPPNKLTPSFSKTTSSEDA